MKMNITNCTIEGKDLAAFDTPAVPGLDSAVLTGSIPVC